VIKINKLRRITTHINCRQTNSYLEEALKNNGSVNYPAWEDEINLYDIIKRSLIDKQNQTWLYCKGITIVAPGIIPVNGYSGLCASFNSLDVYNYIRKGKKLDKNVDKIELSYAEIVDYRNFLKNLLISLKELKRYDYDNDWNEITDEQLLEEKYKKRYNHDSKLKSESYEPDATSILMMDKKYSLSIYTGIDAKRVNKRKSELEPHDLDYAALQIRHIEIDKGT